MQIGTHPTIIRRMTATEELLEEIEAFSREAGIAPSTIGRKSVNDGKLAERLKRGGSVTLETAERIRTWMRSHTERAA